MGCCHPKCRHPGTTAHYQRSYIEFCVSILLRVGFGVLTMEMKVVLRKLVCICWKSQFVCSSDFRKCAKDIRKMHQAWYVIPSFFFLNHVGGSHFGFRYSDLLCSYHMFVWTFIVPQRRRKQRGGVWLVCQRRR